MKTLKWQQTAGQVQVTELRGDKRDPEPLHVRIRFPGGEFEITRTEDGNYWAHIYATNEHHAGWDPEAIMSEVAEGRLDTHDTVLDFGKGGLDVLDENVYHLAFLVKRRPRKEVT